MNKKPTDESKRTLSPGNYPLGSAESRAAARHLAQTRVTPRLYMDENRNPEWDPNAIYGRLEVGEARNPGCTGVHMRRYTVEKARAWASLSEEARRRRVEQEIANEDAWSEAYEELFLEFRGRVPGSVAIARIPKGPPVEGSLNARKGDTQP